jgi:hypothetical protein
MGNETVANMSQRTRKIIAQVGFVLLSLVLISLCLIFSGCTSRPDNRKLLEKQAEVTQNVAKAKAHFAAASVKLREAKKSNAKAAEKQVEALRWMTLIVPAVEQLALKVPDDLKPEVEALRLKVESLSAEITAAVGATAETKVAVDEADKEQDSGLARIVSVEAAIKEMNEKWGPEYFAEVNAMAEDRDSLRSRLNKVLGIVGFLLGGAAFLASTRFTKVGVPATWGIPVGAFAFVYAATFFLGRWGKLFQ